MTRTGATRIGLGVSLLGIFFACLLGLHWANRHNLAAAYHMSNFVRLEAAWLWQLGIWSLAFGFALLASGLSSLPGIPRDAQRACNSLWLTSLSCLLMVLFPADAAHLPFTFSGWIHDVAAVGAVTTMGAAMLLFVDTSRSVPEWTLAGRSFAWPALAIVLGFAWGTTDLWHYGWLSAILQRILGCVTLGWTMALGLRAIGVLESPGQAAGSSRREAATQGATGSSEES